MDGGNIKRPPGDVLCVLLVELRAYSMNTKKKGSLNERRTRDWYLRAKCIRWDYTDRNDKKHGYGAEPATAVVKVGGPALRGRESSGEFSPVDKTWDSYCKEIGSKRNTVNLWLRQWFDESMSLILENKRGVHPRHGTRGLWND